MPLCVSVSLCLCVSFLDGFSSDNPHHDTRAQQAADFETRMIGRNRRKRKVVRIDRYFALGLDHGKQDAGRGGIHFLDRNPFVLRQPLEHRDRKIQFFTEMRAEK